MKPFNSIKLKAAFLLTVFSLNIVVSFACSVGIDMRFNNNHHIGGKNNTAHSHPGKHEHNGKSSATAAIHSHHKTLSTDDKRAGTKGNCCDQIAVETQKLDKSASHSFNPIIKAPFFTPIPAAFSWLEIKGGLIPLLNKAFIPQYYPPPDKRIIIQSFQI